MRSAPATQPALASQPYKQITFREEVRQNPPLHLHVLSIDLSDPAVHLVVAAGGQSANPDWPTTLQTPSAVAAREQLACAVNGDFFMTRTPHRLFGRKLPCLVGDESRVCGWAMSDGHLWSDRAAEPSLVMHKDGTLSIDDFRVPPRDAWQIISGSMRIVSFGKNTGQHDAPAPRTAAGIDATRKTLILLSVDGRRPEYSVGLSTADLADEMLRLGCRDALNLDGGGSTTMVLRDPATGRERVVNYPSDGHDLLIPLSIERPVASTLGVRIDLPATQPSGEVTHGTPAH